MLAVAENGKMKLMQFDIKTTFLYGELKKDLYMEIPKGMHIKNSEQKVFRLKKGIYGLKQAARDWNATFSNFLESLGMKRSIADACVFLGHNNSSNKIILPYADDGLILSYDQGRISS
jgi:hypothetical protein